MNHTHPGRAGEVHGSGAHAAGTCMARIEAAVVLVTATMERDIVAVSPWTVFDMELVRVLRETALVDVSADISAAVDALAC